MSIGSYAIHREGLNIPIGFLFRAAMLAAMAALPRGTWCNSMRVGGYDQAVDLRCCLSIEDSAIQVDFTGTSGVSDHGINVPLSYTQAYASFGVRCVLGSVRP